MSSNVFSETPASPESVALLDTTTVQLAFRCYSRPFVQPLKTAHGLWRDREGIVLQLSTAPGQTGYGEIAPIPWFGTETLAEAIAALTKLQAAEPELTLGDLSTAMERLPAQYSATRFGLGLAIALLQRIFLPSAPAPPPSQICALLPTGSAALQAWPELWQQGHRTFKWKIGGADVAQECSELIALRRSLPTQTKLRLDANGGLDWTTAQRLLCCCDALAGENYPIEFVEQPLPPAQFEELLALSQTYQTPLALDESVTGLAQLKDCYERGWRGIFVIKGAIAGEPQAVIHYCRRHELQLVFSSVFETGLARQAVFAMAQAIQAPAGWNDSHGSSSRHRNNSPALGFGVNHWLQPDGLGSPDDSTMTIYERGQAIWQRLSTC